MCVEVAGRAAELRRGRNRPQHRELFFEPVHEDTYLLAQFRGRCGLSVRMGQQRNLAPLLGQRNEFRDQLLEQRIVNVVGRLLEAVRNRGVVDILRGEPEVHELLERLQSQSVHLLFDQVLDRLHVVVGRLLDLLDPERIGFAEVAVNVAQLLHGGLVHAGELGQRQFAQRDEILHFHQHTVADQRIFGEIIGQHLALVAVTAVDRGYSGQLCQFHVFHSVLTDYKYRFNPVHCKIITKTSSACTRKSSRATLCFRIKPLPL